MARKYTELLWASGLFEGEGCFMLRQPSPRYRTRQASAALRTTDEDVVRRFHSAVGIGVVNGPYATTHKPAWVWTIDGWRGVQALGAMLWNGLGLRRRARLKEVLLGSGGDQRRKHREEVHL